MKSFKLNDLIIASIQGIIHCMNVSDDNIASLLMSWEKFIEDNNEHVTMSLGCISGWLDNSMKVDDDICWKKYDSIDDSFMTDWPSKMRSTLISLAMIVSRTYTNQRTVIERITKKHWVANLCYHKTLDSKNHQVANFVARKFQLPRSA